MLAQLEKRDLEAQQPDTFLGYCSCSRPDLNVHYCCSPSLLLFQLCCSRSYFLVFSSKHDLPGSTPGCLKVWDVGLRVVLSQTQLAVHIERAIAHARSATEGVDMELLECQIQALQPLESEYAFLCNRYRKCETARV